MRLGLRGVKTNQGMKIPARSQLACLIEDGPNGMQDSIGESSITLTTGAVDDLMSASWPFPDTPVMRQLDALEGGDMLFDSTNSMTPITRYGYQWFELFNDDYMWIGNTIIAGYSSDMSANSSRIERAIRADLLLIDGESLLIDSEPLHVN